jgi:hypothetical protein
MTDVIISDLPTQLQPELVFSVDDAGADTIMPDVEQWAQQQWRTVDLNDARLSRRAVVIGQQMARRPGASWPQQMESRAQLKATYRLLANAKVSHEQLSRPHGEVTRQAAGAETLVLLVQDTTELDYTPYADTMKGLGPIGDGRGRGLLLHSTLAVLPQPRRVLGLLHQQVYQRVPVPPGQNRRARPKEERESRVWPEAIRAIGTPPVGSRWVVVADRAADDAAFLWACRQAGLDFTVRMAYERRLVWPGEPPYLLSQARSWAPVAEKTLEIRERGGRPARTAHLQVSFGQVLLRTPSGEPPLRVWVVRVWEDAPPPGVEAIEWILATTVAVETGAAALERIDWYSARWTAEDYHQCLKTGCAVQHRDLEHADRVERLLGFLAPLAVRLLQLREESRLNPEESVSGLVEPLLVALVAPKLQVPATEMSLRTFWRGVAQLGGFLGRRRDGAPGWKTLWRGWLYLQTLAEGARLAASLCGP